MVVSPVCRVKLEKESAAISNKALSEARRQLAREQVAPGHDPLSVNNHWLVLKWSLCALCVV